MAGMTRANERASQTSEKVYSVDIALTEQEAERITSAIKTDGGMATKLGSVATWLLKELARGGYMLEAKVVRQIKALIGDMGKLLDAVEASVGMKGGSKIGYWEIQPALLPLVQELAGMQGRTVDALVQDAIDYAIAQGFIFYSPTNIPKTIFFSAKEYDELSRILGTKSPTSSDIISALASKGTAQEQVEVKDAD